MTERANVVLPIPGPPRMASRGRGSVSVLTMNSHSISRPKRAVGGPLSGLNSGGLWAARGITSVVFDHV